MNYIIKHEIRGRIRVKLDMPKLTLDEADMLELYLYKNKKISKVKVYERTASVAITFNCDRDEILHMIQTLTYDKLHMPEGLLIYSGRKLNAEYKEKLATKVICRVGRNLFLPRPFKKAFVAVNSAKYMYKAFNSLKHGKLEVAVLDATAIGVSMLRRNMDTAGSVMFMLGIGELLEDWTHKKTVGDLATSMALNVKNVWVVRDGKEMLVSSESVQSGETVVVHTGNVIPFDGVVIEGEAMVNQSTLTGEPLSVRKGKNVSVYAGTVVEEGEIKIQVSESKGDTKYEKIVQMIEETEKLKSTSESKAANLSDRLVPATLIGTVITYLVTRNVTKAMAVLMVDYSCALKLAIPVTVLSAIREADRYDIMVKGGKYFEAIADADTIVFDKTGTLTNAVPKVKEVITFGDNDKDEMLRIAACLEEHFPHSMAKAVVEAAKEKNLEHEEMHSKVEYIVAHGIVSEIGGKKVVIGSYHFVFEDEKCKLLKKYQKEFDEISPDVTQLYMAIDKKLVAVICIEDPLRLEAKTIVADLKESGISKVVMMTGDSERTAAAVAAATGVDEYYSEVLPEQKAKYIQQEKDAGRKVVMIGDGINDSPALSASDAGIAVSDGAEIAREIADVIIESNSLNELVTLKKLSDGMKKRVEKNYKEIIGVNTALIALGIGGVITPSMSAFLHNATTLGIALKSMENLLPAEE